MTVFFFNDTATTEIYTLSLHDALPICLPLRSAPTALTPVTLLPGRARLATKPDPSGSPTATMTMGVRSEEHTSELQSRQYLVCRLLLEKKNKKPTESLAPLNLFHPDLQ